MSSREKSPYEKHQRSRHGRYVLTDTNGKRIVSTNDEKVYLEAREALLATKKQEKVRS